MDCDCQMVYDEFEMVCYSCGKIEPACPTILHDDVLLLKQEGQLFKPAKFNPSKHFKEWIDLILGRATFLPTNVLEACANDKTVEDIRNSLKAIKRADLNKFSSHIYYGVTGKEIPKVSEENIIRAQYIFIRVIDARKQINELINKNMIYYPYYIFKIFELLGEIDILKFIHLQNPKTLKKNDDEWRLICKHMNLDFKETKIRYI